MLRAHAHKVNLLSMGHLPRISRAQKADAMSTFGKLAGHRACIEACRSSLSPLFSQLVRFKNVFITLIMFKTCIKRVHYSYTSSLSR